MSATSVSSTVSSMESQYTTTLGWDVVVNYGEDEINALLASAHKNDTSGKNSISTISCEVNDTNEEGDPYTISYKFDLGAPTISFTTTRTAPVCNLTIPIVGGTAGTPNKTLPITNGVYTITIENLELGTAKGSDGSTNYTPADKPFTFPAGTATDGVVVIDLPTSKSLGVSVETTSSNNHVVFIENHKSQIGDALKTKLRTDYNSVRFELARVNSEKPPSDSTQLLPKCFMFTAYTPSSSSDTVLSLFIQTSDSNNGERDSDRLGLAWDSLWKLTLKCSPIPSGHTASIIFNKNMIFNTMVKPTLESQGFSGSLVDTTGNLKMSVSTGKRVHRDKYDKKNYVGDGSDERTVSEIDVTLPDLTLTMADSQLIADIILTVDDEYAAPAACFGYWSFQYHFSWSYYHESNYSGMGGHNRSSKGGITAVHTLDKQLSISTILDDYTLKLQCSISARDWTVTLKGDDQDWWSQFCGGTSDIPDWVKNLSVELPGFELKLGSLYFFLTTNLLMPTQKVIKVDKGIGLQVPGDFYLVGTVVSA